MSIRTIDEIRNDTIMYGSFREIAHDLYKIWSKRLGACVLGMIASGVVWNIAVLVWRNAHGIYHGNLGG